jgi:stage II sporulation protein D
MRRTILATSLCALVCAPAAADAASRYTIKGAGFGHGVGMSQYGAYGMAQQGRNYQQILGHYYRGTVVSLTRTNSIRVLLQPSRSRVTFSGATGAGGKGLNPNASYSATQRGAGVTIRTARGRVVRRSSQPLRVTSSRGYVRLGGTAMNGVTNGRYRGALVLRGGSGVTVVNALGLDPYVQGVVPVEMPSSWHPEALKAQAVAARTYGLASDRGGSAYDVFPTTASQVYNGMDAEVASTNAAVRATKDQIVTHEGQLITTYFFSTSGGKTEDVENVFGGIAAPYLRGVDDPYDDISPRHRWRFGPYTRGTLSAKLGNLCRGSFRRLKVRQRGYSPRIRSADVVCSRGSVRTSGSTLRFTLGLYDSWFSIVRVGSKSKERTTGLGSLGKAPLERAVTGSVDPAPKAGTPVKVERRAGGRWQRAAVGKTGANGSYDVPVARSGAYRVTVAGATGPPLRVR